MLNRLKSRRSTSYHDMVAPVMLLTAIRTAGVQTLVFRSSATVCGEPQRPPLTEDRASARAHTGTPNSSLKKICCATVALPFQLAYRHIAISTRLAHKARLPHPGRPDNFLPYVAQVVVRPKRRSTFGAMTTRPDETGVRDFIHAVDSALGHLKALRNGSDRHNAFTSESRHKRRLQRS